MKKVRLALLLVCLFSLLMLTLVSCGPELKSPTGLYLDQDTLTLRWNEVNGARFYAVQISGQEAEITTKVNYISLEKLEPGEYDITVRAVAGDTEIDDSDVVEYHFVRESESGLKYQLINNDTEYQLIGGGKASGDIVMEDVYRGKPVTSIAEKALYHNSKITSFVVGNNVKTIGAKAFTKCSNMTQITIPGNVTSIGEYAFQSCKGLTKIALPDSVTAILPYTFAWCSSLEEITLSKDLFYIAEYAFSNCPSLKTMTYTGVPATAGKMVMPEGLLQIGSYAFADCTAIADLKLSNNTEYLAPYAFCNNTALTQVDLGTGVIMLDESIFYGCTALTSVAIPNSTQYLGNYVFYGCTALSNVTLGTGLQSVGSQVFADTPLLASAQEMLILDGWLIQILDIGTKTKVTLPETVYGIANYAFSGQSKLEQVVAKGTKFLGAASFSNCEELYWVEFGDELLTIGDYAFYNCKYLEGVDLSTKLQSIGNYAFYECQTLEDLEFPETLTYIGMQAFRNSKYYNNTSGSAVVYVSGWAVDCTRTKDKPAITVQLENGTRGIACYAFANQALTLVAMPDSVLYVCKGAFYQAQLAMVSLSKGLKVIDDYAFYGCTNTIFGGNDFDLTIPEGTEYVGRSAFYKCEYILNLVIPGSVKTIGPYAFYGCVSIGATVDVQQPTGEKDEAGDPIMETVKKTGSITLSEGILSIGERAFQNCEAMVSVSLPNSVVYVGARAFYKCTALTSVTLGSGIKQIEDYTFYKCESLQTLVLSDQLEVVGNYAFRGCAALSELSFKNVKAIGRYAFYGCASLPTIVLPNTLTSVGDYAFRGCNAATAVIIPDSVETIGKHAFYGMNSTTIYAVSSGVKPYWNEKFNSSYRPVVWGCTLSENGSYVVSFTAGADSISNTKAKNGIADPYQAGHTFAGWATEAAGAVAYTSANVAEAPAGTVLYAVWNVKVD